jgi:hypothetical protein
VASGRLETYFSELNSPPAALPFDGLPASALAMPISVQGVTVAVLYADDHSEKPEFAAAAPQARIKFAELLHQHAVMVLLRVSFERKTLGELREYARMLVSELEYAHAADVDAARNPLERHLRLREALGTSRQIYAQRAGGEAPAAAPFLDECIAAVLEARGDTVFGRDLAAIIGSASPAPRSRVVPMR